MPNDKKVFIIAGLRLIVVEETLVRLLLQHLVQSLEWSRLLLFGVCGQSSTN